MFVVNSVYTHPLLVISCVATMAGLVPNKGFSVHQLQQLNQLINNIISAQNSNGQSIHLNNTAQPDSADIPGGTIQLDRGVRSEAESGLLRQVIKDVGIDNVEFGRACQAGPSAIEPEKEEINVVHQLELPAVKKKKVIKVKNEILTYSSKKYLSKDEEEVKQKLTKYGVAILPDRLTEEECAKMNEGMWSTVEYLTKNLPTPVKRAEKETYRSLFELQPKSGGLFQSWGWGHAQYVWDVRSNPKVATVFEKLYKTPDLLVSFDGVNCGLGALLPDNTHHKGLYTGKKNLHCDQRFSMNKFQCFQSWVTANPIVAGDGTLRILEGSHILHEKFSKTFNLGNKKKDWHMLTEEQIQWYKDQGCKDRCIVCPAGAQVCWDSRLIHCGIPAVKSSDLPPELASLPRSFRNVVYICMTPARLADKKNVKKRKSVFCEGTKRLRMASHWPHHMSLFPMKPRYFGGKEPAVPEIPLPNLNTRAKKIAGI